MADSKVPHVCPKCGKERLVNKYALARSVTGGMCWACSGKQNGLKQRGISPPNKRHNEEGTPLYNTWLGIKQRCFNPRSPAYPYYGGRGITMCEAWRDCYETFRDAVGPRPGKGLSLDRVDNSRGYEPGNTRWATRKQQSDNRRSNILVEFRGETHNLKGWARVLSIPYPRLYMRVFRLGWSLERALTQPHAYKPD